jgi:hypothetical protein
MYQLDEFEALRAMELFITRFADSAGNDLLTLLGDIMQRPDRETFDPAAWDDWMRCVKDVKAGVRAQLGD